MDSVLREGVASRFQNAAHVPHFVKLVVRVMPNSIAENHSRRGVPARLLPGLVWFQDWIFRMVFGGVESSSQGRPLDEKIIQKELPSSVNGNDFRRRGQIGNRHRLKRQRGEPRGPGRRQPNAVGKDFLWTRFLAPSKKPR